MKKSNTCCKQPCYECAPCGRYCSRPAHQTASASASPFRREPPGCAGSGRPFVSHKPRTLVNTTVPGSPSILAFRTPRLHQRSPRLPRNRTTCRRKKKRKRREAAGLQEQKRVGGLCSLAPNVLANCCHCHASELRVQPPSPSLLTKVVVHLHVIDSNSDFVRI